METLYEKDSVQRRLHTNIDSTTIIRHTCANCQQRKMASTKAIDASHFLCTSFNYTVNSYASTMTSASSACLVSTTTTTTTTTTMTTTSTMTQLTHIPLRRFCTLLLFCMLFTSAHSCGPGRGIGGPRKNRKLTPLVFKQHVPNMSEKTLGASGLNEGAIKRDSPKFKDLVPNYNKDIIFKDEEGTGADRVMTRRCKEKLNTLAVSVMNQWPGVRLRVTESWDEDNLHGSGSLHYEGRAVDITTSDRDRTKYGMLARLAVEAGFDWVYYESRAHIHCSVKSDTFHISHVSGCFTSDSTVLTEQGIRKHMSEVAIGDRVLSMSITGEPIYTEVILFMDRNLEQMQEFVQITTESGAILTVTAAHLVRVWNPDKQLNDYVFADRIEEGDYVLVHDVDAHLRPQRVSQLAAIVRKGVVAPLTSEGTIVVNSVAASCYAIVNSQWMAHWSMAPMRLLATLKHLLPSDSTSSDLVTNECCGQRTTQQNGIHWYAKVLYTLKDYVVPHQWRYQ